MKLSVKIFNLDRDFDVAKDWDLQADQVDVDTVLAEPYKIACVPAMFTRPDNFAYQDNWSRLDLSKFDLVIISDIEQERTKNLMNWINERGIKRYVLAQGASHETESINHATTVVRSWWMQNLMRMNTFEDTYQNSKPYWFDALLGARRPHRDFVMLAMQKHPTLLSQSIVNYRDVFCTGQIIDEQNQHMHSYFSDLELSWPYVSPNLNPDWEVRPHIEKNISPYVPWNIYRNTWYSAICETSFNGDGFFLTEKTTKALFAQRVFVLFGPCQFLKHLRELGFETFGSVIDEDYDLELVDLIRYRQAFSQMLSLVQQDPVQVYAKLRPILEHNYHRLWKLQQEIHDRQQELLIQHIPACYIID
jgi:hypothetical protein